MDALGLLHVMLDLDICTDVPLHSAVRVQLESCRLVEDGEETVVFGKQVVEGLLLGGCLLAPTGQCVIYLGLLDVSDLVADLRTNFPVLAILV